MHQIQPKMDQNWNKKLYKIIEEINQTSCVIVLSSSPWLISSVKCFYFQELLQRSTCIKTLITAAIEVIIHKVNVTNVAEKNKRPDCDVFIVKPMNLIVFKWIHLKALCQVGRKWDV